jgi:hypothetical protein
VCARRYLLPGFLAFDDDAHLFRFGVIYNG